MHMLINTSVTFNCTTNINTGAVSWPWTGPLLLTVNNQSKNCSTNKYSAANDHYITEHEGEKKKKNTMWEKNSSYQKAPALALAISSYQKVQNKSFLDYKQHLKFSHDSSGILQASKFVEFTKVKAISSLRGIYQDY